MESLSPERLLELLLWCQLTISADKGASLSFLLLCIEQGAAIDLKAIAVDKQINLLERQNLLTL